jgi:transposase-like protein
VNGRRHSPAFKAKVVAAKLAGANAVELGKKYGINPNQIYKWTSAAAKTKPKPDRSKVNGKVDSDIEQIVSELLSSLRPSLVEVIGKLVDLGVERKLDDARTTVMNALRRAS